MSVMRALLATAPGRFGVEYITIPNPGPADVLVRVAGCALCGSDLKLLRGAMRGVNFPIIPGHEWSGTVVDCGREARAWMGTRVVADLLQSCGTCSHCRRRRRNLCERLVEPGLTAQGAFAEYIVVPARTLRRVHDSVPLEHACLAEPLSVVLHALDRQPARQRDRVLVLGGGGIGLMLLSVLRSTGIEAVALVDRHAARRRLAKQCGALAVGASWAIDRTRLVEALGGPPQVVYHAASRATAFADALDAAAPAGRIGVIGYTSNELVAVMPSDIMVKLLDIKGALSPTAELDRALALLAGRTVDAASLLTHRFPLEQYHEAHDLAEGRADGAVRVLVAP